LLFDTDKQFKKSPVYQKQLTLGKLWNYAICATPIQKGKGVLFGINWGGSDGYKPQSAMPTGQDIVEYYFIKQSRKPLKQLGLDFSTFNFNYTNLCFFRTPRANILEFEDYKLSLPFNKGVN